MESPKIEAWEIVRLKLVTKQYNMLGANFIVGKQSLGPTAGRKDECRRLSMVHQRSIQDGRPGLFHAQVDACIREVRQRNFEELFATKACVRVMRIGAC
jgi:hypothetical protein